MGGEGGQTMICAFHLDQSAISSLESEKIRLPLTCWVFFRN